MEIETLTRAVLRKMDARTRIGWIDYSRGSYDHNRASLRAFRILLRARGVRTNREGDPK